MRETFVAGWDVGGAHLKVAVADTQARLLEVVQVACPLWQGMDKLGEAIATLRPRLRGARYHAVTMTGELADLFASRAEGVTRLIEAMTGAFPDQELRIYAGREGLLGVAEAVRRPLAVASANWLASTAFAASRLPEQWLGGLFLDIGSTTTDIVPFRKGEVLAIGMTDEERLASEELVYTGVTRSPVMAIADRVPFAGARQGVMAEHFATMADAYRLTGELPEGADQHPTADGRDKSVTASARRLARMLGRDVEAADPADWRRLAAHLGERQRRLIRDAADRVLSRGVIAEDAPLVGAGIGRFLAVKLAAAMERPYVDFAALVAGPEAAREMAARCAPAAALAMLAAEAV